MEGCTLRQDIAGSFPDIVEARPEPETVAAEHNIVAVAGTERT
jgi:hypothetical protein